jgi:serine-type D-Ala-D-Ala carboxypeptidase/endopeptidase
MTRRVSRFSPGAAVLLAMLLVPVAARAQHFPPDRHLEAMLRYAVEDAGVPGIVLGVLEADGSTRVVSQGSAGEGAPPLGPESRFQIASITKAFVAVLLAEMVGRGDVRLDDPVARFLPPTVRMPMGGGREITLADLATHSSALPNYPTNLTLRGNDPLSGYTVDDLYAFLAAHELRGTPGSGYRYSNVGYGLLGHALARSAGTSLRDLLRERVFQPLGMLDTDLAVAGELGGAMVVGHRGGVAVPPWFSTEAMQGAGAAISTPADLLRFLDANVGSPSSDLERAIRATHEVRIPDGARGAGWGLAWRTGVFPDGTPILGQAGQAGGFRSRIAFLPDRGSGVVVLANEVHFSEDLETTLLLLDRPEQGWESVHVEGERLASLQGVFLEEGGDGRSFVRLAAGGSLTYQATGSVRMGMHPRSDSTFQSFRRPWTFTFRDLEDGGLALIVGEDARSRKSDPATRIFRRVPGEPPPSFEVAGGVGHSGPAAGRGLRPAILLILGLGLAGATFLAVRRWTRPATA